MDTIENFDFKELKISREEIMEYDTDYDLMSNTALDIDLQVLHMHNTDYRCPTIASHSHGAFIWL